MIVSSNPGAVEGAADRADLAVHHPARRDDRGTGVGLGQGDASVEFERRVVVDRAVRTQHAAVPVAGVLIETEVGHQDELVTELVAQRAKRDLRDALGSQAPLPSSSFVDGTPKRMTPPTPTRTNSSTSLRSESTVCWNWPGSDVISRASLSPSATKSGATKSSGASVVSATSRRRAGVRRSRRGRSVGNTDPA